MYTILIADDEKEEREGIAFLLEEFHYPLEKVFAENGKGALSYLSQKKADILFTDVRMPIMDGLELAREARKLYPELKIIIYSGYSEFEYAKTAIQIGVASYILKPVHVEEFQKTMDQVLEQLDASQKQRAAMEKQEAYAKKHYLFQMINNPEYHKEGKDRGLFSQWGSYYRMMLLELDQDFFDKEGPDFEKEILSGLPASTEYLNLNMCQSLLLFQFQGDEEFYYKTAARLNQWILKTRSRSCYIAISGELDWEQSLSSVFVGLEQMLEYRFFIPDTFIFDRNKTLEDYFAGDQTEDTILELIKKDILAKDFESIMLHIDILSGKYQRKHSFSQLYVKFIFSTIYKDILTGLSRGRVSEEALNQTIDRLYRSNDIQEMADLIKNTVRELGEAFTKAPAGASQEVDMVKSYIDTHYGEDLDLVSLAEKVYLSPQYLSTLFKRVTGWGINKYIKTIRMEKAKDLLENTNIKVVDLCTAVGFRNLSYFCQNFREFYGETPEQYRKSDYYHNREKK